MLGQARNHVFLGLRRKVVPVGETEHVVDSSVIDRGSAVPATGLPVKDATVRTKAVEKVVEDVIDLRAAGGAAQIEVVTGLGGPPLSCQSVRVP